MSIISTTIPNLVNGVSQQPYAIRLASQAEEQVNGYSSVVDGLRKRPPTRHSSRILPTPTTNAFIHLINRDANERYVVVAAGGGLRVFRLDGGEVAVNFPNGRDYLASSSPQQDYTAVTVADYTFFVNKQKVVATDGTKVPGRPYEALIWIRQGAYSTTYTARIGGNSQSFTTPDASVAANATQIATDYIATQLYNKLTSSGINSDNGYTVTLVGSVIYISHATVDFTAYVQDGIGDTGIKLFKVSVQRFSDLPAKAYPGFRLQVKGDSSSAFDDYYVEYRSDPTALYGGVWMECAKGGEEKALDPATMPHVLVREADGTFTFKQAEWEERKVGDLDAVSMPSFVGKKLNDIFFHRNRLGLLADENVIFSRAGEFFNFFPSSAIQQLDTDPVDVSVSHVKVSILRHAIPFNESLLLFSDQTQFTLGQAELLTPSTISISQTTEFECSLKAKPQGAGKNVYFVTTRGAYSAIREYFVSGETETNDAVDVTAHCPKYIPKGIVRLAASSNEDVLVALSEERRRSLYIYRYFWNGADKLQSSWSRWDFPESTSILDCSFIESNLWMLVSRPDGTYVEYISLEPGQADPGVNFVCHLDRRVDETRVTPVYNAATNTTTLTKPWQWQPDETYELVAWYGDDTYRAGSIIPYTDNGSTITVEGRVTKFFLGVRYCLRYRFSTLIIREEAQGGGGFQPIGEGRIQLRKMSLAYAATGYFRAEVTPYGRPTYSYVFSGRIVGSGRNPLGDISVEDGTFRFPVMSKNDQVIIELANDTFLPSYFLSAEWEAFFAIRSKRL